MDAPVVKPQLLRQPERCRVSVSTRELSLAAEKYVLGYWNWYT
jgi:hypothetical protein